MNIAHKLYAIAIVCLGASLGSVLRFMMYSWVGRTFQDTYLATLTVNVLGSFLIGILFVIFSEVHSPRLQLLLMTGLLASFTTFSTLSLDALRLLTNGQTGLAMAHVGGQVIFGISFCYFGVKIGQRLL
ncbi:MAG: fluoride efflux transporter CrcB [Gammaproteobacteria bacterium]|nr:MAG: fluoride efflux transporter CrcB [Gammaproteobacteria bacterium]